MPNQLAIIGSPDLYSQAARRFLQLIPTVCINAERMFLESIQRPPTPPPPIREDTPPPTFTSSPIRGQTTLRHPTPTHPTQGKPLTNVVGVSGTNPFDLPVPPAQHSVRSRSGSDASTSSLVSIASSSSAQPTANTSLTSAVSAVKPVSGNDEEQRSIGVGKYAMTPKTNGPSFQFEYITPEMAYFKNLIDARDAILECASSCRCWSSTYDRCIVPKDAPPEAVSDEQVTKKSLEMEDVSIHVQVTGEGDDAEDNFDFARFRSRATTVSAHSKRTSNVRTRHELGENGSIPKTTTELSTKQTDSRLDVSTSPQGIRRRATMRDRMSPRTARKQVGNSFEDKTGLFLKVVLEKLFDMLQYPPALNVLLIRLISRLAQFPQPLLRSLLLNHQLVLRPGIPNLTHVSTT